MVLFFYSSRWTTSFYNLPKKSNYTQEELADKLGVSRQTINSLENGKYNPSIQLAFKLAKFFNLSIEALFIFEEDWNGK